MRKNGSRLISIKQYRFTDLFLFAVILVVFDIIAHFAAQAFAGAAMFTFTLTVPIVLLVMMRWGWPSVFYAVLDGIMLSLLNNIGSWQSYLSFSIGNCFMMLLLLATKFIGKEKIRSKWYFSVLFVVAGWVLMNLGITIVQSIVGYNFLSQFIVNFGMGANGLLSLAMAIVIIVVMRRLNGMFEDQKHFLLRLDEERKELARRDTFGDQPIEIDKESLSILMRDDDGLD